MSSIAKAISSVEESSISISLWLSISRSLSVVSIGVWISSISIMSSIAKAISSVQEIGIGISLWLSISRSLSIVSIGTIGIWVSISVGSVSKTISIEIGISISLWLSISR